MKDYLEQIVPIHWSNKSTPKSMLMKSFQTSKLNKLLRSYSIFFSSKKYPTSWLLIPKKECKQWSSQSTMNKLSIRKILSSTPNQHLMSWSLRSSRHQFTQKKNFSHCQSTPRCSWPASSISSKPKRILLEAWSSKRMILTAWGLSTLWLLSEHLTLWALKTLPTNISSWASTIARIW